MFENLSDILDSCEPANQWKGCLDYVKLKGALDSARTRIRELEAELSRYKHLVTHWQNRFDKVEKERDGLRRRLTERNGLLTRLGHRFPHTLLGCNADLLEEGEE